MAEEVENILDLIGLGASRFPGVQPFEDTLDHRRLFHGRDEEKYELFQLILAEPIVLLFSRSGLGKSSLINAGLLEPLRQAGHFPIVVRVTGADSPLDSLFEGLKTAVQNAAEHGIECEPSPEMWDRRSLWHLFKSIELWREDELLSPVLFVDQFEELFTRHDVEGRDNFIDQLAHLVRGTRPRMGRRADRAAYSDTAPDVKVVLAFREDFYANIQLLRDRIPAIYKAPFRLTPLTRDKALQAITKPAEVTGESFRTAPFDWDDAALEDVLDFLSEQQLGEGKTIVGQEIEPFQLQLICQYVEDLVATQEIDIITPSTLGGKDALRSVLSNFYADTIDRICAAFPEQTDLREKLEQLCEEGLMTPRGRRLLREESTIQHEDGVDNKVLAKMVELRLVRKEPRIGDNYYELTHDTLIEPIQRNRLARLAQEETSELAEEATAFRLQQARMKRLVDRSSVVSFLCLLMLLVYLAVFSPANQLANQPKAVLQDIASMPVAVLTHPMLPAPRPPLPPQEATDP